MSKCVPKVLLSDSRCTGEVHWGVARAEIKFYFVYWLLLLRDRWRWEDRGYIGEI
jgi:hypothetical protein